MKISELHLLAYGPFTERVLDFSQTNFNLVFGPNEAGKSTALRAIDALLFGIPQRSADAFIHGYGKMRVGAKLMNAAGRTLEFARRKKLRKSLVTLDDEEKTLPDNSLEAFLKGMEQERFRRLYCIDHGEFRSGGELMRELKGLANESLVAASHGGGFTDVEAGIRTAAKSLWGTPSTTIKKLIKEHREAVDARKQSQVRVQQWKLLSDQRDAQLVRKKEIADQQTKLQTERGRLQRMIEALPLIGRWKSLTAQLDGHENVRVLPDSYSVDRRRDCGAELASTTQRKNALDEKLCVVENAISNAREMPEVLQHGEAIVELHQRIAVQRKLTADLVEMQQSRDGKIQRVQHWLSELGSEVKPEQAHELGIRMEIRAAIQALAHKEQSLRQKPVEIAGEQREQERQRKTTEARLVELDEGPDTRALAKAVREATRHLNAEPELVQLRTQLEQQRQNTERKLSRLPDWHGSLEDLARSKVPMRDSVSRFATQFAQATQKIETVVAQLEERKAELDQTRQEIAASQRASAVVTEEDLQRERSRRDHGWQLVKRTYFEERSDAAAVQEFAGANSLDAAYEKQVEAADNVADRLRREAKRVGELTKQLEKQNSLELTAQKLTDELKSARQAESDLQEEWKSLWSEGGVRNVRAPQEMIAWLERYDEIVELADASETDQQRIEQLEEKLERQREQLRCALKDFGGQTVAGSLSQLHEHAETVLEQQQSRQSEREQLTKDRKRTQETLTELEDQHDHATKDLEAWQSRWSAVMEEIGCDADVTAEQANARVDCLVQLASDHEEWRRLSSEVERSKEQIQKFADDAKAMTGRIAPELAERVPIEMVEQLNAKLVEARSLRQSAEELKRRRDELKTEIETLNGTSTELKSQLAQFLALAGVDSIENIDQVEALSRVAGQLNETEQQLSRMSGGLSLDEFQRQAEEENEDELRARVSQLDFELAELQKKRDEVGERIGEVETEMERINGNVASATADQQAMNCLTQIHRESRRYVCLKIAESILRQQVERYREENRDPLLSRASQYFAEMTCNEFHGVESDYDEAGNPILVGVRSTGDKLLTQQMSDGTLDPLFLSLRLSYLQEKLGQFEPMPLIVDDILIHLDDDRALATLKALADFARQTQVLVFTHQQRFRELAETHLSDVATIHELEKRTTLATAGRPR